MNQNAQNRRKRLRRRTLLGGTLRFAARTGTLNCVVRNLSAGGARLDLENTLWLPDSFEVDIPHQNLRAPAKVIWREMDAMGIAFDSPAPVFRDDDQPHRVVAFPARKPTMARSDRERLSFLEQERTRMENRIKKLTDEF